MSLGTWIAAAAVLAAAAGAGAGAGAAHEALTEPGHPATAGVSPDEDREMPDRRPPWRRATVTPDVRPGEACIQPVLYRGGPLESCPWAPPDGHVVPVLPGR